MDDMLRAVMLKTFNGLSQERLDDVESQYENLSIILDGLLDRIEEEQTQESYHQPALEIHVCDFHKQLMEQIMLKYSYGQVRSLGDVSGDIWDFLKLAMQFGYEVGKAGWPIMSIPCKEAHEQ